MNHLYNHETEAKQNGRHHLQLQPGFNDMHPDSDPPRNEKMEEQLRDHQQQHAELNSPPINKNKEADAIADSLTFYINRKIKELPPRYYHNIYKVPDSVRGVNPECYTPRFVSIGPIHYDNPSLKTTVDLKFRYFQNFIDREPKDPNKARESVSLILDMESNIRKDYHDEIQLESKDFCKMILLDAVFIVELLLKKQENDDIFKNRWWSRDLLHDILLIENQIPLFVPYMIFEKFYHVNYSFSDLVTTLIKDVYHKQVALSITSSSTSIEGAKHFIDYLRRAYLIEDNSEDTWFMVFLQEPSSEDYTEQACPPPLPKKKNWKYEVATASRLLEYGVRFEEGKTTSLVDIKFEPIKGILAIPQVKVNEWSENLFRNIVAYEQCDPNSEKKVTDYIIFMDGLIDTPEDVNILIDAGIIQDDLQDPEKVSRMFNNLHKEAITEERYYLFTEQSRELNEYRRNLWHVWKARWYKWKLILKRDYFNSPWSTIAFVSAAMLLGLTIVQTVCSIYQAKGIEMK